MLIISIAFPHEKNRNLTVAVFLVYILKKLRLLQLQPRRHSRRAYAKNVPPAHFLNAAGIRTHRRLRGRAFQSPSPTQKRDILSDVSFWWGKVDSNHRSRRQQIYSLPPLATREFPHIQLRCGAGRRTRTPDLLITNQLLYQLSYTSKLSSSPIITNYASFVNNFF